MSYYIELNVVVPLLLWILVKEKGLTIHNSEIFIDGSLSNEAKQTDLFPVIQHIYKMILVYKRIQNILLDVCLGEEESLSFTLC